MSMEMHVFSDRQLASIAEWQGAIDAEGYSLRLDRDVQFATARGFIPAIYNGEQSGFEGYHDDAKETMGFLGNEHFDHPWRCALGFRWGGNFDEMYAAWMAATAYAVRTDGVIFDNQEARSYTPQQARELISQMLRDQPRIDALMQVAAGKLSKKLTSDGRSEP